MDAEAAAILRQEATAYDVLGVDPRADANDIRRAYHNRSRRWHPDRSELVIMALRAAARKIADLERASRKRALAGTRQPPKHFFDPRKKKSAYCEFVHRRNGVDFYAPRPYCSAAGGNGALRPFDEASRAGTNMFRARDLSREQTSPRARRIRDAGARARSPSSSTSTRRTTSTRTTCTWTARRGGTRPRSCARRPRGSARRSPRCPSA